MGKVGKDIGVYFKQKNILDFFRARRGIRAAAKRGNYSKLKNMFRFLNRFSKRGRM